MLPVPDTKQHILLESVADKINVPKLGETLEQRIRIINGMDTWQKALPMYQLQSYTLHAYYRVTEEGLTVDAAQYMHDVIDACDLYFEDLEANIIQFISALPVVYNPQAGAFHELTGMQNTILFLASKHSMSDISVELMLDFYEYMTNEARNHPLEQAQQTVEYTMGAYYNMLMQLHTTMKEDPDNHMRTWIQPAVEGLGNAYDRLWGMHIGRQTSTYHFYKLRMEALEHWHDAFERIGINVN